jgi:L,D-transpeptidase YcbB
MLLAGYLAVCLAGCGAPHALGPDQSVSDERVLADVDPEVAAFYSARGERLLWATAEGLRPEALQALSMIRRAPEHGLDPSRYGLADIEASLSAAQRGHRAALQRADILLSSAYARFAQDIRRAPDASSIFYVDADLAPRRVSKLELLDRLASAPSLAEELAAANRLNPFYDGVRRDLAAELKRSSDPARLDLIRANLARTRLLPIDAGGRYLVVDATSARLWMIDRGQIADTMRVIVGKPDQPTPMMAGLIRFAVMNPYWHIPPDLVPTRVAERVLNEGPDALDRDRLEIVTHWGPDGQRIDASEVNWHAVAAGQERLRVRQLPGQRNMMGAVKFMMPNRLGIYLHDTPDKTLFARSDRRLSSGCVRVEDAARLAQWLFVGSSPLGSGAPEERIDLPEPVPVYITYLDPLRGGGTTFNPKFKGGAS